MKHIYRLGIIPVILMFSLPRISFAQAPKPAQSVKLLFEKVYVHTDRDYYTAGDDIWFKAYLVDAQTNLLNNSSSNLHVELISPQAQVFDTEVVYINNGTGTGDFKLADSIPAGNYRLRAYTNWMLNFGNNFIFEKNITVYNTSSNSKPIATSSIIATKQIPAEAVSMSGSAVIHFFPEGGSLVENVAGIVAFKTEAPAGKVVKARGAVVSSTGDTVAHFESTPQGMGVFVFLPETGKTYTVKGVFNDSEPFTSILPAALPKGYVLHVSEADSAHLKLTISTNQATMADNPDKQVTLMARHAGTRFLNGPIKFVFLQISATVSKKQFPAGISSITIYDNALHPQAERLVYVPDSTSAQALTLTTDKQQYGPKEKVTVKINTSAAGKPVRANLSLAAVDAGLIPVDAGSISSYLLLTSEIKGPVENPEMYFDQSNPSRFKQLDLLLMTQGWRDFIWRRLADDGIHISYPTENGFALSGRLREKLANKSIPNTNISLTVKGDVVSQQYMTKTDTAGKYSFRNIPVKGNRSVTLASFDDKQKKVGWVQMDSLNKDLPPVNISPKYTSNPAQEVVFANAVVTNARTHPRLSDTVKLKEVKIKASDYVTLMDQTLTKFGYPDFSYDITSKYYFYNSLRDFLIHEVPGARTNAADSVVFKGVRFDPNKNHDSQIDILPRFIVNNREDADDLNNGIYLNMTMDVINKVLVRHVLGQSVALKNSDGNYRTGTGGDVFLIFLDIKPNAFEKAQFNTLTSHIAGYYQARTFYKPTYDSANDATRDLRTTLTWEPNIITDANGQATISFYNADPKTKVRVVVQGLTDKGVPVTGVANYVVK